MRITNLENTERTHFDKLAKMYDSNYGYNDEFTKYKIQKKADIFLDFIKSNRLKNQKNFLEVGCGTGAYTRPISQQLVNANVLAVDISPKIIEVAKKGTKKTMNLKYDIRSVYDLGLKDGSVDVVFGFYILHHLDINLTVKQLRKVLKKGGIAFFYEPNILNPVVFAIKSIPFLKRMVNDSPEEWGINPLKLRWDWEGFKILKVGMTEFILPFKFLGFNNLKMLDRLSLFLSKVPILKYFGGSTYFFAQKI